MSRVARIPVTVVKGVDVQISPSHITVKGPLGTLQQALSTRVKIEMAMARCRLPPPTSRAKQTR